MKPPEFLEGIGRSVAYYPSIALVLGNVKQALILCQLIYWSDKGSNKDGWIYKSQTEMRFETGLSFDEQRTARKALVNLGVLEERNAKLEHRLYFRINFEYLQFVWSICRECNQPFSEVEKTDFGKAAIRRWREGKSRIREDSSPQTDLITENTSKKTSQMNAAAASNMPHGVILLSQMKIPIEGKQQDSNDVYGSTQDNRSGQVKNEKDNWLNEQDDWFELD